MPPARNMNMPWHTDPQYSVHRRPIRSSVKTQTSVENMYMIVLRPLNHWLLLESNPAMRYMVG
jgi:hypothetical protein